MGRAAGYIAAAVMAAIMAGCSKPTTFMESVPPRGWLQPCTVVCPNDDTLSMRRLSVVVRYNNDFDRDTLALRITASRPDAVCFTEDVQFCLERPRVPAGVATVESLPYREASVLSERGDYLFTIAPSEEMKGVEAVGINIENE